MTTLRCKCGKQAQFVCLKHNIYLCPQDASKHTCDTVFLPDYIKKIRYKKVDLTVSLKKLKTEGQLNSKNLLRTHKEMVDKLDRIRTIIDKNFKSIIETYKTKIKKLIENEIESSADKISNMINTLERNRKYVELNKYIDTHAFGKVRKKERIKTERIQDLFSFDSFFTNIVKFMRGTERQAQYISDELKLTNLNTINANYAAKEKSYNAISKAIKKEIKYFFKNPAFIYKPVKQIVQQKASLLQSGKKTLNTPKNSKLIPKKSGARKKKSSTKQSLLGRFSKRGTKLIESAFSHYVERKQTSRMLKSRSVNFLVIDEENNFSLNSDSIVSDEIDISDSHSEIDITYLHEIENDFKKARNRFRSIINKTARDVNKDEFFNIEQKPKINFYVKHFLEHCGVISQDLLLNFNKI